VSFSSSALSHQILTTILKIMVYDSFGSHFLCSYYVYAKDLCYYRYMSDVCTSHILCASYTKLSFMSVFVGEREIVDRCACVQVHQRQL